MTFLFAFIFAIINFLALYFLLSYLVDKKISSKKVIEAQQETVENLLVVMGDVVDKNVSMADEKIKDLRSIIDLADRKIRLLEKEQVKFEQGKNTYQELVKRKPLINSVIGLKKDGSDPANQLTNPDLHQTERNLDGTRNRSVTQDAKLHLPTQPIEKHKEVSNYVLQLFREGKSPQEIASQLNIALAEAELIISLHVNKND